MSLSKKYVYVHQCSLADNTPDNFRKVLGRAWVSSKKSGLQYGYDVAPHVMEMTYGPYYEWAHEFFKASELPAKTQIVSVNPNPFYFPDLTTLDDGMTAVDPSSFDEAPIEEVVPPDPCCGWYAYLGRHFANHFSTGTPEQIVGEITNKRVLSFEESVENMEIGDHQDPYFPGNECTSEFTYEVQPEQSTETMAVTPDANDLPPVELMPVINKAVLFRDLWFQIMTPFSQEEDASFEGKQAAMISDVTFNYNFYLDAYESQLRGRNLSELQIPSLYLTIGQDGSLPYVAYLQNNVKCRFKDFEKLILQEGYREYLFPIKQQPWLQDKNMYSTSFPMDATISFGTDRSTFVADALEDSKLECAMLRRVSEGKILLGTPAEVGLSGSFPVASGSVAYTHSTIKDYTPPWGGDSRDFVYTKRYGETTATNRAVSTSPATRNLRTFDFYQWLMALPDLPPSSVALPDDHIFLGNTNDSTDMALKVGLYQRNLSFFANYFILSGKINDIASTHLRTYQQMMRGDTPHSETILYRISKYDTGALNLPGLQTRDISPGVTASRRGPAYAQLEADFDQIYTNNIEPIQNIWIPNSNSIDIVEYVDTQIKYNKGYTYTVTAYELSVGTEYFYSQYSQLSESEDKEEACRVYVEQQLRLKGEINLLEPGSALSSTLREDYEASGLDLANINMTKKSWFKVESCPEPWVKSTTREISKTQGGVELTYLGQAKVEVTCECPPPEPCKESFLVTTIPSLKVHEVPYLIWSGKAVDSYPVGPDVEINAFRAVNNQMLFMIGAGLGDYYARPIPILANEKKLFNELLVAQKSQDGTALFRSDDPVQRFQMFKLTEKPKAYTDFAKGQRMQRTVYVADSPGQEADAVSFIEELTPNKKYYYIFRSIDVHGHVSNPTPIYEVELVDTDGAIYPLINVYEPDPDLPVDLSKQGQRFVQIRPEYLQSVLDEEGSGLKGAASAGIPSGLPTGDIKLGIREEKLWDKKFKLRLTSCETRKMLDINLRFGTEHLTSASDCPPSAKDRSLTGANQINGVEPPEDTPIPGSDADLDGGTSGTGEREDLDGGTSGAGGGGTGGSSFGSGMGSGGGGMFDVGGGY